MATHRNRYVKVALFERCSTNLNEAKVVGQGDDYLLLERAAPKIRDVAKKVIKRTRKVNAHPTSVPSPSPVAEA